MFIADDARGAVNRGKMRPPVGAVVLQLSNADRVLHAAPTCAQAANSKRLSMKGIRRRRSSPATHRACPSGSCGRLRSLESFAEPPEILGSPVWRSLEIGSAPRAQR